jgi:hypothetical protein
MHIILGKTEYGGKFEGVLGIRYKKCRLGHFGLEKNLFPLPGI